MPRGDDEKTVQVDYRKCPTCDTRCQVLREDGTKTPCPRCGGFGWLMVSLFGEVLS